MCLLLWVFPEEDSKTRMWVQIVWDEQGASAGQWYREGKGKQPRKNTLFSLFPWWVTVSNPLEKLWEMVQNAGFNDPAWSSRGLAIGLLGVDVRLSVLRVTVHTADGPAWRVHWGAEMRALAAGSQSTQRGDVTRAPAESVST